ncbi:MAG TPA: hypothetical protein DDW78_07625 [Treponema sp.]|nr:hypothetical protein [Treponema sp.]
MGGKMLSSGQDAWYTYRGNDDDVVVSTKVRLARNLANFPFPAKLRGTDGERIQSIVFDAFNHLEDCEQFQAIAVSQLDSLGSRILEERGILGPSAGSSGKDAGIILRTDGRVACTVNIADHVHISSFAPGMDCSTALQVSQAVDKGLQQHIQFAASYDFGYLTSSLLDSGSGMRISIRVHLPSLSMQGRIRSIAEDMSGKGVLFSASFGSGGMDNVSGAGGTGASLGAYYELSSTNCGSGSELDQLASIVSAGKKIMEMERSARSECRRDMPSDVRNYLYRSVALARSSLFIPLREAIDIISGIKWGTDMGMLCGIEDASLRALLYRIQEGHLEYVLKNGSFKFEKDVSANAAKKNERLRALILQEAFEDVKVIQ